MSAVRIHGDLDANFAWDGVQAVPRVAISPQGANIHPTPAGFGCNCRRRPGRSGGASSGIRSGSTSYSGRRPEGGIDFAARPWTLIDAGHTNFDDIVAVPRGLVVDLDPVRGKPSTGVDSSPTALVVAGA